MKFKEVGRLLGLSEEKARGIYRRRPIEGQSGYVTVEDDGTLTPVEPSKPLTLEDLSKEQREREKKAEQDKLFKQLLQQKSQTDDIVERILDSIPRVPEVKIRAHQPVEVYDGYPETALLVFSDLHVGAVADREETGGFGEYNYPIFRQRLNNLRDAVRSITLREQHFSPVKQCVVAMIGDLIENDSIFPAQQQMIDLDLSDQFLAAVNDISEFLVNLLDTFETLFVPCVTGNHGRIGRKGERKRHINWDYLVSKMVSAKLENYADRIQFEIPKAPFIAANIEGHEFLFRHGDGIKSWMGLPYYGISRSVGRWTAIQSTQNKRFEYMVMGHFHQAASIPFTGGEVLVNGCFPGVTEYSVEVLESLNVPMQYFGFVHPTFGLAARYPVLLDR